ncbi:hypothetical protein TRFO_38601 [Tritrichomonas foetus]|uniref:Uncharacterized protein n=1 Tax=Tritrichomonas foetus TaxID=1144522 RepID=A0A1J4J7Z2_9EUKA|nr:hypothetical protein TRFO_38601 [Tritrichomonas foetus]|eukprot:OHS95310.1 hypothetical protein TRFO_38601 [Tritrichomonas foetus]
MFHEDPNDDDAGSLFPSNPQPTAEDDDELPMFSISKPAEPKPTPTSKPAAAASKQAEPPKKSEHKKRPEKKRVQKFVLQKKENAAPDPMKKALTHFQLEFNQQYESLLQVIESLKPPDEIQGAVLPKDQILRKVQEAVDFADERDGDLLSKQIQIDKYDAGEFENDERKLLREKIAELKSQVDAEKAETTKIEQRINQLQEQYGQIIDEDEQLGPNSQNSETRMRNVLKRELERANLDLNNFKTVSEKRIEENSEQIKILKEQTEKFAEENDLWKDYSFKTEEDLANAKRDFKDKVKKVINDMVDGVMEMIEGSLNVENEYSGDTVLSAMRTALQETGESLCDLDADDAEEEDVEEEEEEDY